MDYIIHYLLQLLFNMLFFVYITLATWCEELTHWKRPWCWERLRAGGEGDNRGWDGWMASPTQWTSVWVDSGSWWWTGRPGVLWFMELKRVRHNWATELNWTEHKKNTLIFINKSKVFYLLDVEIPDLIHFLLINICFYLK